MNIHKVIISNRFISYTPCWWWYRLIFHQGFRFDDYGICESFWSSLNGGWHDMNYKYEFEKFWGKGAKPEKIYISKEDFDALQKRLSEPPDPEVMEKIKKVLERVPPWEKENDD